MLTVLLFVVVGIVAVYFFSRFTKMSKVATVIFEVVFCLLLLIAGAAVATRVGHTIKNFSSEEVWKADIIGDKEPMIFAENFSGYDYLLFVVRIDGKPTLQKTERASCSIVECEGDTARVRVFKLRYTSNYLWSLPTKSTKYEFSVPVGMLNQIER
jgi:hypothetical protein